MSALGSASLESASVLVAAALVWSSALVQHMNNVLKRGTNYAMSDRSVAPNLDGFFGRATRTLSNNIESALMYVPPVLVLIVVGHTSALSHLTAAVYIAARCVFSLSYWLKIPVVRSLAWLVGMICCAIVGTCAALALAAA
jgi:uncharacterized MAPEG superfamily protein